MYIVEILEESLYVPLNKNILYCTLGWEHLSLVYWHYTLHLARAGWIRTFLISLKKEISMYICISLHILLVTSAGAPGGGARVRPPLSGSCPGCWKIQSPVTRGQVRAAWNQKYIWRRRDDSRSQNVASCFFFLLARAVLVLLFQGGGTSLASGCPHREQGTGGEEGRCLRLLVAAPSVCFSRWSLLVWLFFFVFFASNWLDAVWNIRGVYWP